jgi:hypothetical protein
MEKAEFEKLVKEGKIKIVEIKEEGEEISSLFSQAKIDEYISNLEQLRRGEMPTKDLVQKGELVYAEDSGAIDTYVVTLSPAITAYTTGMVVHFKANTINTGAATLNVNGLGAKTIKKHKDVDLADGDIKAGQRVTVIYDGVNFQMQSQLGNISLSATQVEATFHTFIWNNATPCAVGTACYAFGDTGTVVFTDADFDDERIYRFVGFCKEAKSVGENVLVQTGGIVGGFTGLTFGAEYYLSGTPGAIDTVPGTYKFKVGIAISTTQLLMKPDSRADVVASDDLLFSADTERTTTSTTYVLVKRITVQFPGTLRIKFDMRSSSDGAGADVKGRIYKNTVAIGTEQQRNSSTYGTYSEDISGWLPGDRCELYHKILAAGPTCYVRNFRIYAKQGRTLGGTVNTD